MDTTPSVKSKIVVVGDSQCGKTALLNVFAKDSFPEVSLLHFIMKKHDVRLLIKKNARVNFIKWLNLTLVYPPLFSGVHPHGV